MEQLHKAAIMAFPDAASWEAWLAGHHDLQVGIWLKMAKKGSGIPSVSRADALDVALCYGWIDGQAQAGDDTYYLQKYTPRRANSLWSKINTGKAEALIAAGRMQAAGLAEIAAAKADGRWGAAYESPKNVTVPPDLATALEQNKQAKRFFETLNKTNRYSFIWRLLTAKQPETRAARLQKMITMLKAGKTF